MLKTEAHPIINGGKGIYFNEKKDMIVAIGAICPECKTVLFQAPFGLVCPEPDCRNYMRKPFIIHETITIDEMTKKEELK